MDNTFPLFLVEFHILDKSVDLMTTKIILVNAPDVLTATNKIQSKYEGPLYFVNVENLGLVDDVLLDD